MKTVLIVDDQIEICAMHGAYLERHGYRVVTASDGEMALSVARQQLPDVILLDFSLPKRTGVEVARELKRDASTSQIPILLLTAHTYGAVGKQARAAGVSEFLSKPVQPSRVLMEVRRYAPA